MDINGNITGHKPTPALDITLFAIVMGRHSPRPNVVVAEHFLGKELLSTETHHQAHEGTKLVGEAAAHDKAVHAAGDNGIAGAGSQVTHSDHEGADNLGETITFVITADVPDIGDAFHIAAGTVVNVPRLHIIPDEELGNHQPNELRTNIMAMKTISDVDTIDHGRVVILVNVVLGINPGHR